MRIFCTAHEFLFLFSSYFYFPFTLIANKILILLMFTLITYNKPSTVTTLKTRRSSPNTGAMRPHQTTRTVIKPCNSPQTFLTNFSYYDYNTGLTFHLFMGRSSQAFGAMPPHLPTETVIKSFFLVQLFQHISTYFQHIFSPPNPSFLPSPSPNPLPLPFLPLPPGNPLYLLNVSKLFH